MVSVIGLLKMTTTQPAMPRGTRSQSPSAKFYSRTFSVRNTSHNAGRGPADEDTTGSASRSKRRKLNPGSDTETATDAKSGKSHTTTRMSQYSTSRQRDAVKPKRATDAGVSGSRVPRTSSGNAYTKRASALNLHNYPADHHPVGIAIWVIQKIDSARRETSGSMSSGESSPEGLPASSSSIGLFQASGQASEVDEGDDPGDRRQAQRERKIKQRLENWAKNKENDVVARAKLDAKKKFGSNPSAQPILLSNGQVEKPSPSDEKESYIRRRIRDDFTRLMNRQTKVFADYVSKLEPFQGGFSKKWFPAAGLAAGSDTNFIAAGTLLLDVLPALAEKEVSRTSQLAADALIHALENGSLSPESFFDAIAILAENKDILVGGDRVLAQLFSRSSSSGNTKVLRTSSGADSKLFATTSGPFIIYNTIENTETTPSSLSRYPNRSFPTTNSASARTSSRERKPTTKMLSVSELSKRTRSRTSMSPKSSPPKVQTLTRPSKLRGSVSFATSPPPSRKRSQLTEGPISAAQDSNEMESASEQNLATSKRSMNKYQSEQVAPPRNASDDQKYAQVGIGNDLVQNLLDLAWKASQEDTDDDSDLDTQEPGALGGAGEVASTLSVQPSPGKQNNKQHLSYLRTCLEPTARGHFHIPTSSSASTTSPEQVAKFNLIIEQLPTSEANLNRAQIEQVAALYDQLAQGPLFEWAKQVGLSYPEIPRPFTDRDGWRFTGVITQFGEEIVELDGQSWVYPPEHTEQSQISVRRLKRKTQLEQERVFGFPPVSSNGNGTQHKRRRLVAEVEENVAYERLMFELRKAAEVRGLPCNKALSWEALTSSIKKFDASHGITFEEAFTVPATEPPIDELDDSASGQAEASEISEMDCEDDSDYEPDPILIRDEEIWTGSNGGRTSTFVPVNGRSGSLRKLRDRPSSSSSSAQGSQNRAMDLSTVLDPTHAEMSPPASITKYDIRPPITSGTFNTFNGPITSSNTPTASPAGTPYMKLNFNLPRNQSSTSPGPRTPSIATRRASTTSNISNSSLASHPPSGQPLDVDNTNAYNAAKGYHTNNTNTPSNSSVHTTTADPGSPHGLNGGFPGGGIIINAPDKRGDGRGQRRKSKAPDFKMQVQKAGKEGPKVQARAVRGGTVLKFT